MTEWTDLTDEGLLPGKPATSSQGLAFRDNPVAIAEGAENAPKIQGQALDIYLGAHDLNTGIFTITDIGRANVVRAVGNIDTNTASITVNLELSFSNDNGSSWGAWQSSAVVMTDADFGRQFEVIVDFTNEEIFVTSVPGVGNSRNFLVPVIIPSNANAIRWRASGVSTNSHMAAFLMGGVSP